MHKSGIATVALWMVLGGSLPVQAGEHPGRLLASNCFQCHGTDGKAVGDMEPLAGKDVYSDLKEMQLGLEGDPDSIMRPHALGYTDEQIRWIADYFRAQPER
ncbi:MAG: cytochrome C [Pseudomonadota bacterium]